MLNSAASGRRTQALACAVLVLLSGCGARTAGAHTSTAVSEISAPAPSSSAGHITDSPLLQARMTICVDRLNPATEAVRLALENGFDTGDVVYSGFVVESYRDGVWSVLTGVEDAGSVTVAPGEYRQYALGLPASDGRLPGCYRVRAQAAHGDEQGECSGEYEIDSRYEGPDHVSYKLPPEMTPENEALRDRYMRCWGGLGDVMDENFHEQDMRAVLDGSLYLLFGALTYLEEGKYDGRITAGDESEMIPADLFEGLITRRFPVTAEQVRARAGHFYDAARNAYVFGTGYGGGGAECRVLESSQDGDLLTLTCGWYSWDGMPSGYQNRVVIRLSDDGEFMYIQNEVLQSGGANPYEAQ